jgi:Lon protease-like protein
MMSEELPLFPLNTVLFPGMPLTLHIFEEHYRSMIKDCLDENIPFVVVASSDMVDELLTPSFTSQVGTIAHINASVQLDDGRYLITTVGQQRFRVNETVKQVPYMIGNVELLPDEQEVEPKWVQELQAVYDLYWDAISTATGFQNSSETLPDDPIAMTYHLAHRMQVTNERKQRWLEVDAATRAREISMMLRAEIALLPRPSHRPSTDEGEWSWSWN